MKLLLWPLVAITWILALVSIVATIGNLSILHFHEMGITALIAALFIIACKASLTALINQY